MVYKRNEQNSKENQSIIERIMMRKVENFHPLQIGFIAHNKAILHYAMWDFSLANKEDILIYDEFRNYIKLKDGTEIYGISDDYALRGKNLDQIIIYKNVDYIIGNGAIELLHDVINQVERLSCVPEEYMFMLYNDDEGE